MDAQQFLAEFGHIVSAPESMQQLRELIFQLAVSGRLVRRDTSEGQVGDPLAEAEHLQGQYETNLKVRRGRPHPELREDEHPYGIPNYWRWKRLEQIALYVQRGKSPSYGNSGSTYVVSQKCVQWKGFDLSMARYIDESSLKNYGDERFLQPGDLLWNSTGTGTVGRVAIYNEKWTIRAVADSHVTVIRLKNFVSRYLWCVIASPWVQARMNPQHEDSIVSGTTNQVELATSSIRALPIPCPPLAEQQRIVAKVDELMGLCDKFEAQQREREKVCQRTRPSVFQSLSRAKTPKELQVAWRRVEENALLLLDSPESVRSYKGAILDLAMAGLLLADKNRADSTGKILLREITQRREMWMKSAKEQELKEASGMQKKVQAQRIVEPNLEIPKHWTWGSLLQISQAIVDCHNKTAPYTSTGIHLVRTTDIRNGRMDLKHTRKITPDTYAYWSRRLPPRAGDLIFTREAPMGEAAIVPDGETICLGQRTMLIRLFPELFNNKFLLYAIYSPTFQERMVTAAIGMTVKHLRVGDVEDLMVPVPPKKEQDRIVSIIDALFTHCDQLGAQLSQKYQTASNLAIAAVEAITGIRTKDNKSMKAPKTDLVSNLRRGANPRTTEPGLLAAILAQKEGLSSKELWNLSGLEIDAFYQQLKTEMANGWIEQPEPAYMKEVEVD